MGADEACCARCQRAVIRVRAIAPVIIRSVASTRLTRYPQTSASSFELTALSIWKHGVRRSDAVSPGRPRAAREPQQHVSRYNSRLHRWKHVQWSAAAAASAALSLLAPGLPRRRPLSACALHSPRPLPAAPPTTRRLVVQAAAPAATTAPARKKTLKALDLTKRKLIDSNGGRAVRNVDSEIYELVYQSANDSVVVMCRTLGMQYATEVGGLGGWLGGWEGGSLGRLWWTVGQWPQR